MRYDTSRHFHAQRHQVEVPIYAPPQRSAQQKAADARAIAANLERLFGGIDRLMDDIRQAAHSQQRRAWVQAQQHLEGLLSQLDRIIGHAPAALADADADTAVALRSAPQRRDAVLRAMARLPAQPEAGIAVLPGEDKALAACARSTSEMGSTTARYQAIEANIGSWIAGLTTAESRVLEARVRAGDSQQDGRDPLVRQLQRMTPQRRRRLLDYLRDGKRRARADVQAANAAASNAARAPTSTTATSTATGVMAAKAVSVASAASGATSAVALQCQKSESSAASARAASHLNTPPQSLLDSTEARIVARIDGITDNGAERAILELLMALAPVHYSQLIERLRTRKDGRDTYLERLYADLHGEEFQQWLALDRAKRIAQRAGSPESLDTTMATLERGQGLASFTYAPSQLTAPATWNYRSYPHQANYDQQGHVRLLWRTHDSWHQVSGTAQAQRLAPDALIRVHNRVTGTTDILTAAQAKALADTHETDANVAKVTVIGIAAGAALVGASRTLVGKVATVLFEIALPALGQYVAEHEHDIAQMQGGRQFLRAWQMFNLGMAGFGILRLAWGPGRALVTRVQGSADDLRNNNPGNAIAEQTAVQVQHLGGAIDEVRGAARLVAAGIDEDQALRLLAALGEAGIDAARVAGLSDDAVRALGHADRALSQGRLQEARRHLDQAGLAPSEHAAVKQSLTRAHGGLMTDAITPDGKPAPALSDRIPEHRVSRAAGGFSDGARAKRKVRARRRELGAKYGKDYVVDLSDSEIYAEHLYRSDRRVKEVTLGEPKAAERLGMEYEVAGDKRPMVDLVVEDKHGRLVPTEVKNQEHPRLSGKKNDAVWKFGEISNKAPQEIADRIDHYEIIVHRDSLMPANFKATASGELWYLVDGASNPQVWQRWEFGGKPVILRRGDLGPISR